jgi:hypothetical protein
MGLCILRKKTEATLCSKLSAGLWPLDSRVEWLLGMGSQLPWSSMAHKLMIFLPKYRLQNYTIQVLCYTNERRKENSIRRPSGLQRSDLQTNCHGTLQNSPWLGWLAPLLTLGPPMWLMWYKQRLKIDLWCQGDIHSISPPLPSKCT